MRRGRLDALSDRLPRGLSRQAERARARLERQVLRPGQLARASAEGRAALTRATTALARCARDAQKQRQDRLAALAGLLRSLGYTETLRRGFAVVRDDAGKLVQGAGAAQAAGALEIEFSDGRVPVIAGGGKPARKARKNEPEPDEGPQGSLF